MARYAYRLLNVFSQTTLGGNALCVFEDGRGLDETTMLALARQFNLSETTFLLPSSVADARVRIFTPGYEMPFAGHPTLGSANVVRSLRCGQNDLRLEFKAGIVSVSAQTDVWTLTAPTPNGVVATVPKESPELICAMLGLQVDDLASQPLWIDTGADQLLIPLNSVDAVRRAQPASHLLAQWPISSLGRKTAYVFAYDRAAGPDQVVARYFFTMQGGGVAEDPATGSACANLGGWLLHSGHALPLDFDIRQGDQVERPSHLHLHVSQEQAIQVSGRVVELGSGHIDL